MAQDLVNRLEIPNGLNINVIKNGILSLELGVTVYHYNDDYRMTGGYGHVSFAPFLETYETYIVEGKFSKVSESTLRLVLTLPREYTERYKKKQRVVFEYDLLENKLYYIHQDNLALRGFKLLKVRI